jgi:hypothetical protein
MSELVPRIDDESFDGTCRQGPRRERGKIAALSDVDGDGDDLIAKLGSEPVDGDRRVESS